MRKYLNLRANIALGLIFTFLLNTFGPLPMAQANEFLLPAPGVMVRLSPEYNPPILKGIKVHPDNPFRFEFILDQGDHPVVDPSSKKAGPLPGGEEVRRQSIKLIKYFLASLTIPEKDLWVNLSPYEKNRIIPNSFGLTEMGRDLLAEDYMLKQITASLIYPEGETGKKFWKRIYQEAAKKFGTTNIPVNTFNKVWIVPEKAVVFENAKSGTAYIVESKLKVMLEQDYLALSHSVIASEAKQSFITVIPAKGRIDRHSQLLARIQNKNDINALGSQIVREIIIPELTKEINEGKNFTQLRQVYNSLILATWYKKKIKDSILAQVYSDKNKIQGLVIPDSPNVIPSSSSVIPAKAGIQNMNNVEFIYQRYLQAFKKGVYNYIKEDQDPVTQQVIPRKYFSGGLTLNMSMLSTTRDSSKVPFFSWAKLRLVSAVLTAGALVGPFIHNGTAQANAQQASVRQKTEAIFKEIAQKHKNHEFSISFDEEDTARDIGKGAVDILLDKLEKATQKKDKDEIASAILLLGVLRDEKALDKMMQIYDQYQDDEDVPLDVLAAVAYFDQQANNKNKFVVPKQLIRFYLKASQNENYRTLGRFDALRATESGNIHDGERMEAILKWALDDNDPQVRAGAIYYAIWAKPYSENANMPKFREFLLNFRDKENSPVVMAAVMRELEFRFIQNADTKEYLKQVFNNDSNDERLRLAALKSLVEYEGPDIEDMFKGLSSSENIKFRGTAMEWLGKVHGNDKQAIDKLIHQAQEDANADVRAKAFFTLKTLNGEFVFNFFMDQARHGTTENRISALRWLNGYHQKDPQVKDLLLSILQEDKESDVRKTASMLLVINNDPGISNSLLNQYILSANPMNKETEDALNATLLGKAEEFHGANDEEKRSLFDFFEQTLRDNRFPKSIYYNIGSDLIDIADDALNQRPDRDKALRILKSTYRLRMTAIASQMEYSSILTMVVNNSINALDEKATDDLKLRIQDKYGRLPQGILFYLTVPDVVLPILEARQRIGKTLDLDIFTAGAFAEGYILIAKGIVAHGSYTEELGVVDTIGLDSFPTQEEVLKRNGMLPKNFDGFVKKKYYFKDIPSLLQGYWALWLQEKGYYRSILKTRYGINPDTLSREEIEVGAYAAFVSKDFDQILKLNGPLFLGKAKKLPKQDQQHGVVVYNAQWPAATAEWLRGLKIFMVEGKPIAWVLSNSKQKANAAMTGTTIKPITGKEALISADAILKSINAIGIVIGGVSKTLRNPLAGEAELSKHKDLDVLVFYASSGIRLKPFQGGIDWWQPRLLRRTIAGERTKKAIQRTIFVNGNKLFLAVRVKTGPDLGRLKPGLYMAARASSIDLEVNDILSRIPGGISKETQSELRDEIEGSMDEKVSPVWEDTFGPEKRTSIIPKSALAFYSMDKVTVAEVERRGFKNAMDLDESIKRIGQQTKIKAKHKRRREWEENPDNDKFLRFYIAVERCLAIANAPAKENLDIYWLKIIQDYKEIDIDDISNFNDGLIKFMEIIDEIRDRIEDPTSLDINSATQINEKLRKAQDRLRILRKKSEVLTLKYPDSMLKDSKNGYFPKINNAIDTLIESMDIRMALAIATVTSPDPEKLVTLDSLLADIQEAVPQVSFNDDLPTSDIKILANRYSLARALSDIIKMSSLTDTSGSKNLLLSREENQIRIDIPIKTEKKFYIPAADLNVIDDHRVKISLKHATDNIVMCSIFLPIANQAMTGQVNEEARAEDQAMNREEITFKSKNFDLPNDLTGEQVLFSERINGLYFSDFDPQIFVRKLKLEGFKDIGQIKFLIVVIGEMVLNARKRQIKLTISFIPNPGSETGQGIIKVSIDQDLIGLKSWRQLRINQRGYEADSLDYLENLRKRQADGAFTNAYGGKGLLFLGGYLKSYDGMVRYSRMTGRGQMYPSLITEIWSKARLKKEKALTEQAGGDLAMKAFDVRDINRFWQVRKLISYVNRFPKEKSHYRGMVRLLKSLLNKDAKEHAQPLIKELSGFGPLPDNLWRQMTEIEDHLPEDNPWKEKKYRQYRGIAIELIRAVEAHMRIHEEIPDEQIHEIIGTDLYAIEPLAVYSKTMIMTSNGNRINLLEASQRKGQLCYFEIQGRKFVIFAQADKKLPQRGIFLIDNISKSPFDQAMISLKLNRLAPSKVPDSVLVPIKVSYNYTRGLEKIKDHRGRIVDLLNRLQKELKVDLGSKQKVREHLFGLGHERVTQELAELASLLRSDNNFPYYVNIQDPRPPLRYGIEENNFFKIGKNLYICPSTESFRRHFVYKTDNQGHVLFAYEFMIPGELPNKRHPKVNRRQKVAEHINYTYSKSNYSVNVIMTCELPYQGKMLYGEEWEEPYIQVGVYNYDFDGKRFSNVSEETKGKWADELGVSIHNLNAKLFREASECFWAAKLLGYVGSTKLGNDFHPENLRINLIYDKNGKLVDTKVQFVADFQSFLIGSEDESFRARSTYFMYQYYGISYVPVAVSSLIYSIIEKNPYLLSVWGASLGLMIFDQLQNPDLLMWQHYSMFFERDPINILGLRWLTPGLKPFERAKLYLQAFKKVYSEKKNDAAMTGMQPIRMFFLLAVPLSVAQPAMFSNDNLTPAKGRAKGDQAMTNFKQYINALNTVNVTPQTTGDDFRRILHDPDIVFINEVRDDDQINELLRKGKTILAFHGSFRPDLKPGDSPPMSININPLRKDDFWEKLLEETRQSLIENGIQYPYRLNAVYLTSQIPLAREYGDVHLIAMRLKKHLAKGQYAVKWTKQSIVTYLMNQSLKFVWHSLDQNYTFEKFKNDNFHFALDYWNQKSNTDTPKNELIVDPNDVDIISLKVVVKGSTIKRIWNRFLLKSMSSKNRVSSSQSENNAMLSKRGGIDFTKMDSRLRGNDNIQFHLDPAMLKQLQNAPGFVPVIINIQPLGSLREFLGIS